MGKVSLVQVKQVFLGVIMNLSAELKRLILYHYRRAGYDRDLREFQVVLEKDSERVRVGEIVNCEGTFHKPKQVYRLIEQGWKVVAIQSCFRWSWEARRYVSEWDIRSYSEVDQDRYGRSFKTVLYSGWFVKIDVATDGGYFKRYWEKFCHCHDTDEEKDMGGSIPKEIYDLFEVRWLE